MCGNEIQWNRLRLTISLILEHRNINTTKHKCQKFYLAIVSNFFFHPTPISYRIILSSNKGILPWVSLFTVIFSKIRRRKTEDEKNEEANKEIEMEVGRSLDNFRKITLLYCCAQAQRRVTSVGMNK